MLRRTILASFLTLAAPLSMPPPPAATSKGRIICLGASGLVGKSVSLAAQEAGYAVTGVSRNKPTDWLPTPSANDEYVEMDCTDSDAVESLISSRNKESGPIVAVVHSVGALFDGESGLGKLNAFASGVGSVPAPTASYDDITRKTAFAAIDSLALRKNIPFVFVSCAEAGWPDMTGGSFVENNLAPDFLKRYLKAKRAVESRLGEEKDLRSTIFRPSLIYTNTKTRPPPVLAFTAANLVGIPFVDKPTSVEDLTKGIMKAVESDVVSGVKRESDIQAMIS